MVALLAMSVSSLMCAHREWMSYLYHRIRSENCCWLFCDILKVRSIAAHTQQLFSDTNPGPYTRVGVLSFFCLFFFPACTLAYNCK